MPTDTTTDQRARDSLEALALRQRRDLCGHCGGSPTRPCSRCARQRGRIVQLYEADLPLVAIAAGARAPVWRVEQILEQERDRAGRGDPRAADAELLRPELDGLVDIILAGPHPPPGEGWEFDDPRLWRKWVGWTLELTGWHIKAVRSVLAGTHIPNAPLRARVEEAKRQAAAAGTPLTSEVLAAAAGISCGTFVDRLLGTRPVSRGRKGNRVYGGGYLTAIRRDYAARIADAIGAAHYEIPGL